MKRWGVPVWNMALMSPGPRHAEQNMAYFWELVERHSVKVALLNEAGVYQLRSANGEADALLVPRLDRLARDLVLQETIIARLTRAGREVLSVAEPDLNGDHTRDLIRQILGAIAQYERALIAARMSAGKALKKAKGGYAGGRPRYGYEARDRELAPLLAEQNGIRLARKLRKNGLSLRQIGQHLLDEGCHPRVGVHWHPTQVARLLTR